MPHEHPLEGGPSSLCGGQTGLGGLHTWPKDIQVELSPSGCLSGAEPCFPHPTHCYPLRAVGRGETLQGPGSPALHFVVPVRAFASRAGTL